MPLAISKSFIPVRLYEANPPCLNEVGIDPEFPRVPRRGAAYRDSGGGDLKRAAVEQSVAQQFPLGAYRSQRIPATISPVKPR